MVEETEARLFAGSSTALSTARCERRSGLAQMALESADHAANRRIFSAQALDLADGTDDRGVILAAKPAADLRIAHVGQLARQVHRDHARMGDGAMALGSLEVMQLDVEVGGHLALYRLDGEAARRMGHQLGDGLAGQLHRDGLSLERGARGEAQERSL